MVQNIIEVIVPVKIDKTFFYLCNENINIGDIVYAEFNKIKYHCLVINIIQRSPYKLKLCFKTNLHIGQENVDFIQLVSKITFADQGEILKMMLFKQVKYNIDKYQYHSIREEIQLNIEQVNALNLLQEKKHILLNGITGSGKTEVYLKLIKDIGQYLILVPEIALVNEILNKARIRLSIKVHSYHSKMTTAYRYYVWNQIINGENIVIVGTRSALFLPFINLKLIVVDEEHDMSYKQDHSILYQARDLALYRCKHVILSSATLSVDSMAKIQDIVRIECRYNQNYPRITFVKQDNNVINKIILEKIIDNFKESKQSMLFLNKKGMAHIMQCTCNKILRCNHCDANMIYYMNNTAICHHCLFKIENPICHEWQFKRYGIEQIYNEISKNIPEARTVMVHSTSKNLDSILKQIHNKEIDIIICTQILSKGYNFKHLSFVGILDIDTQRLIDPRALERTFQIIYQVSGRVGRGDIPGEVYIESNNIIKLDDHFLSNELEYRKKHNIVPFRKLISIIFISKKQELPKIQIKHGIIYGPVEAPVNKMRNLYRYRALIEYSSEECFQELRKIKSKNLIIDSSPYYFY